MLNLEFCDRYSYPPSIKELYKTLLSPVDPRKVKSVLLYGSSSAGEMGFCINNGKIEVYSDYDLLVIAKGRRDRKYQKQLLDYYSSLEQKYPHKFPHIDFTYKDLKSLKRGYKNRPDVQFTIKNAGVTIFGEDLRLIIPSVSPDDFSPVFKIDLLLGKLWLLVLYFPKEILLKQRIPEKRLKKWCYDMSKLYLELIIFILVTEGILSSTYRERNNYLKNFFSNLKASNFFNIDLNFLEECYIGKTRVLFQRDPLSICLQVIEQYLLTRKYIFNYFGIQTKTKEMLFSNFSEIPTPDDFFLRKIYDFYLLVTKLRPFRLNDAYNWYFHKKYCLMFDFLYSMNAALYYHLKGEYDDAMHALESSHNFLKGLLLNKAGLIEQKSNDFAQNWLLFRKLAADFRCTYFPSLRFRREKINL